MNFGVHISFSISAFFKYTPTSIVSGSYGSSIFRFLQNLHTVFHSGCTNVHHTNSVQGFPFLHILANIYYLVFSFLFFSTIANLTGVKWYLIVTLICISLVIWWLATLSIYSHALLAICILSSEKCLFSSSAHFLIKLFWFFDVELYKLFIYVGW